MKGQSFINIDKGSLLNGMPDGGFIVKVDGCCLDSDESPMRIKEGDCILIRPMNINLNDETDCLTKIPFNKIIGVSVNGTIYIKEVVFIDLAYHFLRIKQYNPLKYYNVSFKRIDNLFDVVQVVKGNIITESKDHE
jgi:hypothetical protein